MILNKEEINTLYGSTVCFPDSVWTDASFVEVILVQSFVK